MEISIDHNGNPLLSQFSEGGFVDCVFKINSIEESQYGHLLNLKTSFNGNTVGLNVGLSKQFEDETNPTGNVNKNCRCQKIAFYSSGVESDLLVTTLSRLFNLGLGHLKMKNEK